MRKATLAKSVLSMASESINDSYDDVNPKVASAITSLLKPFGRVEKIEPGFAEGTVVAYVDLRSSPLHIDDIVELDKDAVKLGLRFDGVRPGKDYLIGFEFTIWEEF